MTTSPKQVELDTLIQKQLANALGRAAKEAGHEIASDDLTCEMGAGFTVLTAPIVRAEPPTDKELSRGINLLFAYLSFAEKRTGGATTNSLRAASGKLRSGFCRFSKRRLLFVRVCGWRWAQLTPASKRAASRLWRRIGGAIRCRRPFLSTCTMACAFCTLRCSWRSTRAAWVGHAPCWSGSKR